MQVRTINLLTDGILLPPAKHLCQKCATDHEAEMPHNQESLFWHSWFYKDSGGHWPTWADAMAHCSEEMKGHWTRELKKHGVGAEELKGGIL